MKNIAYFINFVSVSDFNMDEKIIIAGPCALESREQYLEVLDKLGSLNIRFVRAPLWKPRTEPGWEGLGNYALPLLLEEALKRGITPSTEILTSIHAQMIVDALKQFGTQGSVIVWTGARNQNHFEIRKMATILSEGPPNLKFMFKNQIWVDKRHWLGLFKHIIESGFPRERLLTCHRGFNVGYGINHRELRNIPDYEMSMEIKETMGIPMILDPSHIAGAREKVFEIVLESLEYDFDGYLVEVHNDISKAKTDQNQQLTFEDFERFLSLVNSNNGIKTL